MLKKFVIGSAAILLSASAFAQNLISYEEVVQKVQNGRGIRVVIDFAECTSDSEQSAEFIGSVQPKAVMLVKGKYVTFSDLHFSRNLPDHVGISVLQSTKFKLSPENVLSMKTEFLDPKTYESYGKEYTSECELNKGAFLFGVK